MRNGLISEADASLPAGRRFQKAILVTNYSCNLRCTYCDVEHLNKQMLSFSQICVLLRELKNAGAEQINIIGGEPFLRRDLGDILSECRRLGLRTVVHSNGNFVRPPASSIFETLDVFHTCLNGARQSHEKTRGERTYEPTIAAIKLMKDHGVTVASDMILTVDNANTQDIDHVLGLAGELGFRVNFQPVFDHQLVAADSTRIESLLVSDVVIRGLFESLAERYDPSVMYNSLAYLKAVAVSGVPRFSDCLNGRRTLVVGPRGNVARCFKYMQDADNPSGLELGWPAAFDGIRLTDCTTCPYSNHAEDNIFMGLRILDSAPNPNVSLVGNALP